MAERRMFSKQIIDSDAFLDMPLSAQALYFHLGMRADDDGFVNNAKKIQRMIGASDDDCKLLIAKRFILTFESGVIVIKHWRIHNYIQKDRYKETAYKIEKSKLEIKKNNSYSLIDNTDTLFIEENAKTKRQKAYEESELPYSFDYKIRQAFVGKHCPICNCLMNYANNLVKPSIQHNIPISKGGKHELGNISVICESCNASIQDKETGELNAKEVIEVWENISCTHRVHKMDTQDRLGKDSIVKYIIKEKNIKRENLPFITEFLESIDNAELREAYSDFIDMRKEIKAPITTERMLNMLIKKVNTLAKDTATQIDLLNEAIFNKWKSVYPIKSKNATEGKIRQDYGGFDLDSFEEKLNKD